jgi:cell division transport system permease protein
VGATDAFIRRPFLLQGALKGLCGGLLAVGLSYLAHLAVTRLLIAGTFFTVLQAIAIIAFGMAIGLAGSAVSVARHLRRV